MNGLGANGAVPEACEASRPSGGGSSSAGICVSCAEEGPEAAEDAGAGAERHDCCVFPSLSSSGSGRRWVEGGRERDGDGDVGKVSCESVRDTGAKVESSGLRRSCADWPCG
jgi:hypothetical protein